MTVFAVYLAGAFALLIVGAAFDDEDARPTVVIALAWPAVVVLWLCGLALLFGLWTLGAVAEAYVWVRNRSR